MENETVSRDQVVTQTYPHLEIILVNDGSPDQSEAICKEFFKKDTRVFAVSAKKMLASTSVAEECGDWSSNRDYITLYRSRWL